MAAAAPSIRHHVQTTAKPVPVYDDTSYSTTTGQSLGGFIIYKPVERKVQLMLQRMYEDVLVRMQNLYQTTMAKKEILWVRC